MWPDTVISTSNPAETSQVDYMTNEGSYKNKRKKIGQLHSKLVYSNITTKQKNRICRALPLVTNNFLSTNLLCLKILGKTGYTVRRIPLT